MRGNEDNVSTTKSKTIIIICTISETTIILEQISEIEERSRLVLQQQQTTSATVAEG